MDSTTPEATPGSKLLAELSPDLVEYFDEFLAKELPGSMNVVVHIDASGKRRKMTVSPTTVHSYN